MIGCWSACTVGTVGTVWLSLQSWDEGVDGIEGLEDETQILHLLMSPARPINRGKCRRLAPRRRVPLRKESPMAHAACIGQALLPLSAQYMYLTRKWQTGTLDRRVDAKKGVWRLCTCFSTSHLNTWSCPPLADKTFLPMGGAGGVRELLKYQMVVKIQGNFSVPLYPSVQQ